MPDALTVIEGESDQPIAHASPTKGLPKLSPQKRHFIRLLTEGHTQGHAFGEAFGKQDWTSESLRTAGSRLRLSPEISLWMLKLTADDLEDLTKVKQAHEARMGALRDIAVDTGEVSVAVTAEKNIGLLNGLYIDRLSLDPAQKLSPEAILASLTPANRAAALSLLPGMQIDLEPDASAVKPEESKG